MTLSPVFAKPVDMIGSILVQADIALESEVSALKALAGYVKPAGLSRIIATLLHRVWNAVKAVFGQSDWQKAERALASILVRVAHLQTKGMKAAHRKKYLHTLKQELGADTGRTVINKLFRDVIRGIDQGNKAVKPLESFLVPVVDKIISTVQKEAIAAALKKDIKETLTFLSKEWMSPELLYDRGFVSLDIVDVMQILENNSKIAQSLEQLSGASN